MEFAPLCAPELGVIFFPSMTSMNHLSSLYWVLFASSPSDMPKSKGVWILRALIVWTAASRTWVVDSIIGEYAEVLVLPKPTGGTRSGFRAAKIAWAGDSLS